MNKEEGDEQGQRDCELGIAIRTAKCAGTESITETETMTETMTDG